MCQEFFFDTDEIKLESKMHDGACDIILGKTTSFDGLTL